MIIPYMYHIQIQREIGYPMVFVCDMHLIIFFV